MSLSFDIQNILVLLVGFIGMVYGLIVYSGNKKIKQIFGFFICFICRFLVYQHVFFFRSSVNVPNAIFGQGFYTSRQLSYRLVFGIFLHIS